MEPADSREANLGLSRGALRHELVRQLLAEIFQGRLPSGSRLIVLKLAERFGLSSTPVREALVELEAIGMIRLNHNRGAVVNPFGPGQLREIYQIRRILETEAARTASGRMGQETLDALQAEMTELIEARNKSEDWAEQEMALDRRFHNEISAAGGSTRLAQEIRRYDTLVQAVRDVLGDRREAQQQALKDHLTIIAALRAGDAKKAAAAMWQHIENSAALALAAMFPDAA
jgi:DNA-binding GntR family transcriptional regulator